MALDGVADGGRPEQAWDRAEDEHSLDFILELLRQDYRREIIRHLGRSDEQIHSLDEIVDRLARMEREKTGSAPEDDDILSMVVHVHCPKLREAGLVDYDVRSRELRYESNEAVERVLETLDDLAAEL